MESQIQCPVCTLYLHAGMNLQDHLELHPKEKVIAALVNLTLFQQQPNGEPEEDYDDNQYDLSNQLTETQITPASLPMIKTIPTSTATRTYHQNNNGITTFSGPIQQQTSAPTARQVMIVDRTRVFHERSNVAIDGGNSRRQILSHPIPHIISTPPKIRTIPIHTLQLITANDLATKQSVQSLRPPPPYCLSVKDNESNIRSNDRFPNTSFQQESTSMTQSSGFEQGTSIAQNIYNVDADKQNHSKSDHGHEADVEDTLEPDVYEECTPDSSASVNNSQKLIESNCKKGKSVEKRTAGLQVISNVMVTPTKPLNITSLNSQIGDSVSMNDMLILGSASAPLTNTTQPSISKAATSHDIPSTSTDSSDNSNANTKNDAKSSMETPKIGKIKVEKDTATGNDNVEVQTVTSPTDAPPTDDANVACSSKATSVIRMASQTVDIASSSRVSTSSSKLTYNRLPKKLVVKLKKPFVPVIEEEANLHAPEKRVTATVTSFNSSTCSRLNKSANDVSDDPDMMLECSEDVPYSPIRQSYTPQLPSYTEYQDIDEHNNLDSTDLLETKYVPSCSYKLESPATPTNLEDLKYAPSCSSNEEDVIVFQITIEQNGKKCQNTEANGTWKMDGEKKLKTESKPGNYLVMSGVSTFGTTSTSLSCTSDSVNSKRNHLNNTSEASFRLPTFYRNDEDHSHNQLPHYETDASASHSHFNSKGASSSHESDKRQIAGNTIDRTKITLNAERAHSTDSLNIITDEKMPAKGEISEQESNGDIENSWSHQLFLESENMPRYTSSYDTTVARESWSLSNEQNLPREMENMSSILSNFTIIDPSSANIDIKPSTENLLNEAETSKGKDFVKSRKYRCPVCSQIFTSLKEKRSHLINAHDYQESFAMIKDASRALKSQRPIATITSGSSSALMSYDTTLISCKVEKSETPQIVKPFASLNNYLLSYNWNTLKARSSGDANLQNLFAIIDSGTNYVCKVCEEKFNSIRAYDIHMVIHPAECYTCGRTFKRWVNFSIHLKRHLNIREHCCSHCPKRFVLRQNMIEHMRIHSNEAPLKCGICMKRFKRYSNLIQHRNRHHLKLRPKDKDYICSCGEVFHSQAKIAWHRETHDAKPKCCPYCRERFMHKNSLVRHIRLSHTERFHLFKRDSVECPYCKKKYIKSSLKVHMEQHKAAKTTYECTICNKSLTTKWNLKQHKWIHASRSSKPFKCTTCTKAFVRETEYISHMNTHKSIKPYTCDHCGCQFARKYNWLRHTREHTTPKNFRCDTCYKVFHRAYYLKEHKRSHTGERPYECTICGKTSTTKTNHNKHVKIHHARDPLTAEV